MKGNQSVREDRSDVYGAFEPFDLSVNLGPEAVLWLSATSRAGSLQGIPRLSQSLPPLPDILDMVYDYADAVKFAELQPHPPLLGVLYDLVFGEPLLLQLFQKTRGVAADRGRQMLVRILPAPHLAVLPWELLPDPTAMPSGQALSHLALAPDIHLVRLARGVTYPARAAQLEAPLNMLLVLSSPTFKENAEDFAFDIFEVKRGLLAELAPLVKAGLLQIDVEDRPTLDNLRSRIGRQRRGYHLFHYVGHALPEMLIMEDRAGQCKHIQSSQFMDILRLCPDLRLAVFAGCETARPSRDPASVDAKEGWRNLLSLADYCVQETCPAVIAMQAVLPFSTERVFTRFFYQALASGYSVAEAMRLARGAIHGDERLGGGLLNWSVPVLFVGSSEPGPLVPRTAPALTPAAEKKRWELKLGLRQSQARFFGRDLPLRQAVEVMNGRTPERVLLITGPMGVGKTYLVSRVYEELGDEVTHVLYLHIDQLVPEVAEVCTTVQAGKEPDISKLAKLKSHQALKRLCDLVAELLRYSGMTVRAREPGWDDRELWERLIEDLVQHRFVLMVDDIGLIDRLQHGLLETLMEPRLAELVAKDQKAPPAEQLPDNFQRLTAWSPDLANYLTEKRVHDRLIGETLFLLGDLLDRLMANPKVKPAVQEDDSEKIVAVLKVLEEMRQELGWAFQVMADRRSNARILLTASEKPRSLLNLPEELIFDLRLAQITWPETWRLIRRSLPALLSYGEAYLARLWWRLGPRLERWEELERQVLLEQQKILQKPVKSRQDVNLQKLAEKIVPPAAARPVGAGKVWQKRGQRPLRLAVAGPYIAEPGALAEALSQLAIRYGIAGRVVDFDEAGTLATLIDEPSPFMNKVELDIPEIIDWLQRIREKQPDIVLLDYVDQLSLEDITREADTDQERGLLRKMQNDSLLIGSGGNLGPNSAMITIPSAYSEVLSVGPLDHDMKLRPYAEWHPGINKPDLFMTDDLSSSPLAAAIKPARLQMHVAGEPKWGSPFAALQAMATATLFWSIRPDLSPLGVRNWLVGAGKPIETDRPMAEGESQPRSLTMEAAISLALGQVLKRALKEGPASLPTLSAITGFEERVLSVELESMIDKNLVIRLSSGRLERFQLAVKR